MTSARSNTDLAADSAAPILRHAHAVLHCNVNTVAVRAAEAFYERFAFVQRMRSLSTDTDASALGIAGSTASETTFLYDSRGPRSAPAIEFVEWRRPATRPQTAGPTGRSLGFTTLGLRVTALEDARALLADGAETLESASTWVRGAPRPTLRTMGPDGVAVDVVEVPDADGDDGRFSHVRLRSSDLAATVAWYARIGFRVRAGDSPRADGVALVLPEDPTFSLEFDLDPDADPVTAVANTQGLFRIALAVEDVHAAHQAQLEAGAAVAEPSFIPMPDTPTGGFTVMVLKDPDGAVVELVSRPRSAVRRPSAPA
ncbi:VOC family protein [Tomitella biformata]|uniref:VOC family protein n=1 Tax=Tomitella biformata TaxID=630403 RepID=UPI000466DFF7|nr:VOC family protein [Tomitella biformata]